MHDENSAYDSTGAPDDYSDYPTMPHAGSRLPTLGQRHVHLEDGALDYVEGHSTRSQQQAVQPRLDTVNFLVLNP